MGTVVCPALSAISAAEAKGRVVCPSGNQPPTSTGDVPALSPSPITPMFTAEFLLTPESPTRPKFALPFDARPNIPTLYPAVVAFAFVALPLLPVMLDAVIAPAVPALELMKLPALVGEIPV